MPLMISNKSSRESTLEGKYLLCVIKEVKQTVGFLR